MKKIASFTVDHRVLTPGIYISRTDGDITTYDLRVKKPNTDDLISNAAMHSFEHIFATVIRNSTRSDEVIYFGPMGCQTGFYLLMRSDNHCENIKLIKSTLENIISYDGSMPGASEIECGNYKNLDLSTAKALSKEYLDKIKDVTEKDIIYSY